MAGSSGMPWARAATKAGLIAAARWRAGASTRPRFRLRGATDEATEKLMAEVKELLPGMPARELARLAPEVLAGVLPRIYPQMLDEVYAHQDAGRPTFIVSAAGDELVELLARDARHGRRDRHPLRDRRGRAASPASSTARSCTARARSTRCATSPTEHDIDLAESCAYSDSASDLPMLRAVGNPVAVNPDEELARGRPRRGLARDALREARPPARRRRAHGGAVAAPRCWRRHRLGAWIRSDLAFAGARARRS